MKDQFLPYNLALQLKELGFNEPCLGFWELFENSCNSYVTWGGVSEIDEEGDTKLGLSLNELEGYYSSIIKAPLWQQAFDFLIERLPSTYTFTQISREYFTLSHVEDNKVKFVFATAKREELLQHLIKLYQ